MRLDLTNKIFGRLTVLNQVENDKNGKSMWLCKCECGNRKIVRSSELSKGDTKSCGCLRIQKTTERNKKSPYLWIYTIVRQQALYVGREFSLKYEDILEFVKQKECHYCGKKLLWSEHGTKENYHGHRLDRVDNNRGYVKENCVVCCSICNRIKGNQFSHDEMLKIGKFIRNIIEERNVEYDKPT